MDFHQALADHYRIRHLALGGPIVGGLTSAVSQGLGPLGEQLSGTWKDVMRPDKFSPDMPTNSFNPEEITNQYNPGAITNSFNPDMPTNSFQATAPEINQMNFQPGLEAGMAGYNAGAAGLGGSFANQNALAQQAGQTLGAQQNLYGQQQGLADALLAQSRGQGPNPIQAQLQQNLNQNLAQQASAIASTRGINPALAARMASQQGGQMRQEATGQAAVLGAQQQLAAQQALAQQQQAMGQNLQGQNQTFANQGNLYGQAAGTAGTLGGLGAGLYGTNVQGQNSQNQIVTQGSLGAQGLNAGVAEQNANLGAQGQTLLAGVAQQNANLAAHQQDVQSATAQQNAALAAQRQGLQAGVAQQNANIGVQGQQIAAGTSAGNAATQAKVIGGLAGGLGGPAVDKALESAPAAAAHGGEIPDHKAMALAHALMGRGGNVPGQAKVQGDSEENDVVPTVLSPKEIVLPRTVTMADDAPEKAAEFVSQLKNKKGGKSKGYGGVLEKHREVQKRMDELEALIKRSAS